MRLTLTALLLAGLAGLTGCAADPGDLDPAELALDELAPPVFLVTAPPTVAPGDDLIVTVSGTLGEDEEVELHIGRGGLGAGPCLASYGGLCLDVRRPVLVARGLVGPDGAATLRVPVPSTVAEGLTIGVQGVVIRGARGSRSVKSNAAEVTTSSTPPSGSQSFSFTGGVQSFTVPAGVTELEVEACGGSGGDGWNIDVDTPLGLGGAGGFVHALVPVTPGAVLSVYVGGAGGDGREAAPGVGGFNGGGNGADRFGYTGGGGGGATDLRTGNTLTSRLLVAGGGGAGSGWCTAGTGHGGAGGSSTGASGQLCSSIPVGTGGTQSAGGNLGGGLGTGGSATTDGGAGGGGGYYGGGASNGSGGGGGSSWVVPGATTLVDQQGGCTGDGSLMIAW